MKINNISKPDIAEHYRGMTHVVRGDFIRLLYSVILDKLTCEKALELLSSVPLHVDSRPLTPLELVTKIWTHGSMFPVEYANRFVDVFELFCIRNSLDAQELVTEVFTVLRHGTVLPGRIITHALVVYPFKVDEYADAKKWLLEIFTHLWRFSSRNSYGEIVHTSTDGSWNSVVIALAPDKTFSGTVPGSDLAFWMISAIRHFPLCINCKPFEEVSQIADMRNVTEVCTDKPVEISGQELVADSRCIGRLIPFGEVIERQNLDTKKLTCESNHCVQMVTEALRNSTRGRSVLQKNCVYGAPAYLFKIRYLDENRVYRHALDFCIKDALSVKTPWKLIKKKHHDLRSQLLTEYRFDFHVKECAMFLNGHLLIRNIPAQILRNLLYQFNSGVTVVERRTLLDDPSIVFDRSNPGIEIRLKRLIDLLKEQAPLLKIERKERGLIQIATMCNVRFRLLQ